MHWRDITTFKGLTQCLSLARVHQESHLTEENVNMCRITSLRYACTHKVDTTDEECALKHRFPTGSHFISKLDRYRSTDCPDCEATKTREEEFAKVRETFRKSVEQEAAKACEETRKRAEEEAEARKMELQMEEAAAIFYSVTVGLHLGHHFFPLPSQFA